MGNGAITVSQIDADAHPVMELSVVPEVQAKMLEYSRQCRQREAAAQRMALPVRRPGFTGRRVKMSAAQTAVEPPPHKLAAGSGFAMAKWRNGWSQVPAGPQAQITSTSSTFVAGASDPADSTKPPAAAATPEVLTKSSEEKPTCSAPRQNTDFRMKPSVCTWFAPVRLLPRKAANEEAAVKTQDMVAQPPSAQQEATTQEPSTDSGSLAVTTRFTLREVYASCSQELARSPRRLQPSDPKIDSASICVPPAATPFRKLASVASWLPHLDCVEEAAAHNESPSSKEAVVAGPAAVMQVDASVGAMVVASIVARTLDSDGLDSSVGAVAVEALLLRDEGMTSRVKEAPQFAVPAPPSNPVKGSFRRSRLQRGSMSSPSNADSRASTTASSTLDLQPAVASRPAKEQEPRQAATVFCSTASQSAPTCVAAFCQMHVCASSVCSWMHEKDAGMRNKFSVAVEKQSKPASIGCVAAFCQMHVCDASVCSSMHKQEVQKEIATETPAGAATTGSRFCQMHVCAAAVCRWMHEQ
eukprot:TRINITY_DN916_c0_g1_i2.p1 TRINITY_DN916_c0_g1~~TRINITY_DN916_c0_g1_i2.p1  ORF type:complete len:528 (-),score=114.17 TRINITY_DN916_c0_g1_i2:609-2192(-)